MAEDAEFEAFVASTIDSPVESSTGRPLEEQEGLGEDVSSDRPPDHQAAQIRQAARRALPHLQHHLVDDPDAESWEAEAFAQILDSTILSSEFERRLHQAKLEAMRELAYGASHQINNPLTNIATRAQTLLQQEEHPEKRKTLATVHSQAMRAFEMIASLMHFAKPPSLQRASSDLNAVVVESWAPLQHDADLLGIDWQCELAKEEQRLDVDRHHLTLAMRNIFRNAIEALDRSPVPAPQIRTLVAPNATSVAVEIADNGPGMSATARAQAFDPFYSDVEAGRGMGVGLSHCWQIVRLHGGEVTLPKVDQGTCVRLTFPK